MRRVCCECGFVKDPGNGPDDETSHGHCTPCYEKVMAEIKRADAATSAQDKNAKPRAEAI